MKLGNAVANLDYRSNFRNRYASLEVFDLFANDVVNFARS